MGDQLDTFDHYVYAYGNIGNRETYSLSDSQTATTTKPAAGTGGE